MSDFTQRIRPFLPGTAVARGRGILVFLQSAPREGWPGSADGNGSALELVTGR